MLDNLTPTKIAARRGHAQFEDTFRPVIDSRAKKRTARPKKFPRTRLAERKVLNWREGFRASLRVPGEKTERNRASRNSTAT